MGDASDALVVHKESNRTLIWIVAVIVLFCAIAFVLSVVMPAKPINSGATTPTTEYTPQVSDSVELYRGRSIHCLGEGETCQFDFRRFYAENPDLASGADTRGG